MTWIDWLVVVIPVAFVFFMGIYSRRYLKDVTAFLSAGRVCGRYVISMGDIANALSIIGILAAVEVQYKTGFALNFWGCLTMPIGVILGLYGYGYYRFRETKAQSIGEYIELRYSRKLRIFSAALRSFAEMLANMIMPAVAARFFMYFLDLPEKFNLCGIQFSTFNVIMVIVLTAAIFIICMGGSLSIIVTDTIQGFICYPLMALFVVYILWKFSWSQDILPVLSNRAEGESFLDPFDIEKLRDFNYFLLIAGLYSLFMGRLSWHGAGGSSSAAKSPHEQKMAGLLGTWRGAIGTVFGVLLGVAILAFMNSASYAPQAHEVRVELTNRIAKDVVKDQQLSTLTVDSVKNMQPQKFNPATDSKLSDAKNIDTRYLDTVHKSLKTKNETQGNTLFQQFRTLYYQQMLPVTLRNLLPAGMLGLFCLLMILAMVSTDDSRIFSATITLSQDVVMPLVKKELTPRQHMWMLRWVAIGVGVFFYFGSSYMSQLDYINMYVNLVTSMWLGACGPMLMFGIYSRFGTTWGAWVSLVTGMCMSFVCILIQRNWANAVYPWLADHGMVESVGNVLAALSRPFEPIILWRMNPVKCPINSYEIMFIISIVSLILYVSVSFLTCKEPFNLERMLHRGKYAIEGERNIKFSWTWKNLYNKLIGITPEYTFWDKVIAWSYFFYSIVYRFIGTFIIVLIWNIFDPWPLAWWGWYFLIVFLIVPGFLAAFTAVWFGICGTIDLRQMFIDLEKRVANALDDGRVEGNVSLADKEAMEKIEAESSREGKEEAK